MLSAFICRIKSSTGLRVISGGGNFSKSPKTAEEYSLSGEKEKEGQPDFWANHGEHSEPGLPSPGQ